MSDEPASGARRDWPESACQKNPQKRARPSRTQEMPSGGRAAPRASGDVGLTASAKNIWVYEGEAGSWRVRLELSWQDGRPGRGAKKMQERGHFAFWCKKASPDSTGSAIWNDEKPQRGPIYLGTQRRIEINVLLPGLTALAPLSFYGGKRKLPWESLTGPWPRDTKDAMDGRVKLTYVESLPWWDRPPVAIQPRQRQTKEREEEEASQPSAKSARAVQVPVQVPGAVGMVKRITSLDGKDLSLSIPNARLRSARPIIPRDKQHDDDYDDDSKSAPAAPAVQQFQMLSGKKRSVSGVPSAAPASKRARPKSLSTLKKKSKKKKEVAFAAHSFNIKAPEPRLRSMGGPPPSRSLAPPIRHRGLAAPSQPAPSRRVRSRSVAAPMEICAADSSGHTRTRNVLRKRSPPIGSILPQSGTQHRAAQQIKHRAMAPAAPIAVGGGGHSGPAIADVDANACIPTTLSNIDDDSEDDGLANARYVSSDEEPEDASKEPKKTASALDSARPVSPPRPTRSVSHHRSTDTKNPILHFVARGPTRMQPGAMSILEVWAMVKSQVADKLKDFKSRESEDEMSVLRQKSGTRVSTDSVDLVVRIEKYDAKVFEFDDEKALRDIVTWKRVGDPVFADFSLNCIESACPGKSLLQIEISEMSTQMRICTLRFFVTIVQKQPQRNVSSKAEAKADSMPSDSKTQGRRDPIAAPESESGRTSTQVEDEDRFADQQQEIREEQTSLRSVIACFSVLDQDSVFVVSEIRKLENIATVTDCPAPKARQILGQCAKDGTTTLVVFWTQAAACDDSVKNALNEAEKINIQAEKINIRVQILPMGGSIEDLDERLRCKVRGNVPPGGSTPRSSLSSNPSNDLRLGNRAAEFFLKSDYVGRDLSLCDGFVDPGRGRGWKRLRSIDQIKRYYRNPDSNCSREILVVDSTNDQRIRDLKQTLLQKALTIRDDLACTAEKKFIQVINYIANLVFTFFGGDASLTLINNCIRKVKSLLLHRPDNLVYLGELKNNGVCRHRSILFKYLCDFLKKSKMFGDNLAPSVRLIRGAHGGGGHAWNILWHPFRKEFFLVDLMIRNRINGVPQYICATDSPRAQAYRRQGGGSIGGKSIIDLQAVSPEVPRIQLREIDTNEVVMGKRIGKGSFGTVFCGDWHGTPVAMKQFDQPSADFWNEVKTLVELRHPHIVETCAFSSGPPPFILMEKMDVSLEKALEMSPKKSLADRCPHGSRRVMTLLVDVARGLNFLHKSNPLIVHQDLKPLNILIDTERWKAKLCDFGISKFLRGSAIQKDNAAGTPEYAAPELWNGTIGKEVDIYAFGVVIWRVVTGRKPWDGLTPGQIKTNVLFHNKRPQLPSVRANWNRNGEVPMQYQWILKIIERCWEHNARDRPNCGQILNALKKVLPTAPTSH